MPLKVLFGFKKNGPVSPRNGPNVHASEYNGHSNSVLEIVVMLVPDTFPTSKQSKSPRRNAEIIFLVDQ